MKQVLFLFLGFAIIAIWGGSQLKKIPSGRSNDPNGKEAKEILSQLEKTRDRILALLTDPSSRKATLSDSGNTTFQCLLQQSDCRGKGGPFRLREANGEIFFDPGLAEAGFSVEGKSCRTPSPQHCPAKVSLKWKALCESDLSCKTPTIFVEGELKHSAGPRVLIRKEISPEELAAIGLASHSETRSPVPLNKAPAPKSSLMEAVKSGFRGDSSPSVISFVPAPEAIHKPLLLNPSIHQKQAPPPASLSGGQ